MVYVVEMVMEFTTVLSEQKYTVILKFKFSSSDEIFLFFSAVNILFQIAELVDLFPLQNSPIPIRHAHDFFPLLEFGRNIFCPQTISEVDMQ